MKDNVSILTVNDSEGIYDSSARDSFIYARYQLR